MMDILKKIEAYKREEIAAAKAARPLSQLERDAKEAPPPRGFLAAIEGKIGGGDYALITEVSRPAANVPVTVETSGMTAGFGSRLPSTSTSSCLNGSSCGLWKA